MATVKLDKGAWHAYFDRISKLAVGKQAEIEVASLNLGDQIEAEWVPLLGITYDPKTIWSRYCWRGSTICGASRPICVGSRVSAPWAGGATLKVAEEGGWPVIVPGSLIARSRFNDAEAI
jgi:hypothetical protein